MCTSEGGQRTLLESDSRSCITYQRALGVNTYGIGESAYCCGIMYCSGMTVSNQEHARRYRINASRTSLRAILKALGICPKLLTLPHHFSPNTMKVYRANAASIVSECLSTKNRIRATASP